MSLKQSQKLILAMWFYDWGEKEEENHLLIRLTNYTVSIYLVCIQLQLKRTYTPLDINNNTKENAKIKLKPF